MQDKPITNCDSQSNEHGVYENKRKKEKNTLRNNNITK